jgi:hypothetical protein
MEKGRQDEIRDEIVDLLSQTPNQAYGTAVSIAKRLGRDPKEISSVLRHNPDEFKKISPAGTLPYWSLRQYVRPAPALFDFDDSETWSIPQPPASTTLTTNTPVEEDEDVHYYDREIDGVVRLPRSEYLVRLGRQAIGLEAHWETYRVMLYLDLGNMYDCLVTVLHAKRRGQLDARGYAKEQLYEETLRKNAAAKSLLVADRSSTPHSLLNLMLDDIYTAAAHRRFVLCLIASKTSTFDATIERLQSKGFQARRVTSKSQLLAELRDLKSQ